MNEDNRNGLLPGSAAGGREHFVCPECGKHVTADEDGCCVTCGANCTVETCDCGGTGDEPVRDAPGEARSAEGETMQPCCDEWARMTSQACAPVGGGYLSPGRAPKAQFDAQEDGAWAIFGCCGGECYVVTGMRFCPFCGASRVRPAGTPPRLTCRAKGTHMDIDLSSHAVTGDCPRTKSPGQGAAGCSPRDFMNSVRELYSEWLELARRDDPSLVRLPDFEAAMDYVEAHGIGPCLENSQ